MPGDTLSDSPRLPRLCPGSSMGSAGSGGRLLAAALFLVLAVPTTGAAQLRPLDPLDWDALDSGRDLSVAVGVQLYADQAASLAGTRGRLIELGAFRATWLLGRAALQVSGTAVRLFHDETSFADPVAQARPIDGDRRLDVGDQRISTILRLSDGAGAWDGALRFGVRLPTTDNREGLERDRTDFFTTVSARHQRGALKLAAEIGVGVLGTRSDRREQVDPILFAGQASYDAGSVHPDLVVVGQHDTRPNRDLRGNEDLGEVRLGARIGEARWIRLAVTRGWETFSPDFGLLLEAGLHM